MAANSQQVVGSTHGPQDLEERASPYVQDGSVDIHGQPALRAKTGNWRACPFILATGSFSHFCSRSLTDQPGGAERNRQATITEEEEDNDWSNDDADPEPVVKSKENNREGLDQEGNHADASDDDYMKPQPRKARIRKCLAKLKKGPDGRFINVLEVTSDMNMLIAAYQSLKAKSRPTYLIEDSDDDDSMEGINIQRFKKLQKRLRSGTYRVGTSKEPKER